MIIGFKIFFLCTKKLSQQRENNINNVRRFAWLLSDQVTYEFSRESKVKILLCIDV